MPSRKLERTFIAADAAGSQYTIEIWRTWATVELLDGRKLSQPAVRELLTDDGQAVNYVRQGEYQLVIGNVPLTSTDPTAP